VPILAQPGASDYRLQIDRLAGARLTSTLPGLDLVSINLLAFATAWRNLLLPHPQDEDVADVVMATLPEGVEKRLIGGL
jgi:hypothetical protein